VGGHLGGTFWIPFQRYEQPGDRFSEADAKYLAKKMLGALSYLHANKIVHRDLKLENFIFTSAKDDADIKLIDFGFSRQCVF
jgi:serine/threonine protein kinase